MKHSGILSVILIILFCFPSIVFATDRLVPGQYSTIQSAINSAIFGDRVLVANGYYSSSTNGESFPIVMAAGVILQGADSNGTTIDGGTTGTVIETADNTTISGFTMLGSGSGGEWNYVIYCESTSVVIENNIIYENGPSYGIACWEAQDVSIKNNIFNLPHGVDAYDTSEVIVNENIFNMVDKDGVGVSLNSTSGDITNNIMHGGWRGIDSPNPGNVLKLTD